ncbi:MAG: hypothetical protein RLY18_1547, partial [Pseudomonadota bacterium]
MSTNNDPKAASQSTPQTGIRKGLTRYGDTEFSLFMRKAFIKAMGFSDSALDRPIIGITNTYSDFNPCHGNVPQMIEAINVFARNLKDLLLAAPAGPKVTIGLDPGMRTGVKVAVVDATGKVVDTDVIYPHQPKNDWEGSLHTLAKLAEKHQATLISIGNGTASRETDK